METRETINQALSRGHLVDITTTGRRSGKKRQLDIAFHNIDGRIYISGMPSPKRRNWLSNLDEDPHFTFHLKGQVKADLPATARVIEVVDERREILPHVARAWRRNDVDRMVEQSPLIEVLLDSSEN
jgi:deazaflavin-dependent oxidoreductase (nitroreductase family)